MNRVCVHDVPVDEMCAPCAEFGFEEKYTEDEKKNMDRFLLNCCAHALTTDCIYCKRVGMRCEKCNTLVYEAMYETGMQSYCSCQCDLDADWKRELWRKTMCVCDCLSCKVNDDCASCGLTGDGFNAGDLCNE